jgi:hypothetical protein
MDSYSQFQVHYGTERRYPQLQVRGSQRVEMPSSWFGSRGGGYRSVVRTINVMGTVETEHYGRERVEYGRCMYSGWVVVVVQNGTVWKAVERKGVDGCIA